MERVDRVVKSLPSLGMDPQKILFHSFTSSRPTVGLNHFNQVQVQITTFDSRLREKEGVCISEQLSIHGHSCISTVFQHLPLLTHPLSSTPRLATRTPGVPWRPINPLHTKVENQLSNLTTVAGV